MVDGAEFYDLDVVLKELQPLFRHRGFEQFADVLPRLQEGAGIVADALDRSLPLGDVGQILLDLLFFLFEPFQLRLDAGQPPRPEALQHIHQPADVGMDLGEPPTGQVFGFTQPVRLAAQAGKCFLHDAVAGFDHPANRGDPPDDRVLQGFRRNARRLTGVFAAFVLLPRADVVVVHVGAAVGRRPNHVRPALAPQKPGEQVHPAFRLLEVHAAGDGLADLELHPVELLLADDRLVATFLHRIAPANLPDVDGVAEDADDFLLGEAVAAPLLVRAGAVDGIADAEVVQPPRHRAGGAEFLKQVEDASDDGRPFLIDFQLAWIVLARAVAQDVPAVPQAPVGPVPHDRKGALGGHLPLKLGEDHDELHHCLAGRHRGVELFPQGDDIHVMLGEQRPQVHEVLEAACNPVQLEADHQVDLAGGDVAFEPLKLRPFLVLCALARINVELQRFDFPVLAPLAELDFLLDLVLLGGQAVTLGGLTLRRHADVSGDPKWPAVFLVGFAHVIHLLSGERLWCWGVLPRLLFYRIRQLDRPLARSVQGCRRSGERGWRCERQATTGPGDGVRLAGANHRGKSERGQEAADDAAFLSARRERNRVAPRPPSFGFSCSRPTSLVNLWHVTRHSPR